jgi:hypothetical protein
MRYDVHDEDTVKVKRQHTGGARADQPMNAHIQYIVTHKRRKRCRCGASGCAIRRAAVTPPGGFRAKKKPAAGSGSRFQFTE